MATVIVSAASSGLPWELACDPPSKINNNSSVHHPESPSLLFLFGFCWYQVVFFPAKFQPDFLRCLILSERRFVACNPTLLFPLNVVIVQGFSVDGTIYADEDGGPDSFVDKCVRVDGRRGHSETNPLRGFVMKDMAIHNCG